MKAVACGDVPRHAKDSGGLGGRILLGGFRARLRGGLLRGVARLRRVTRLRGRALTRSRLALGFSVFFGGLLAGVVGGVPAGPFELERRVGDQLADLAPAGRALLERLLGDSLGYLELTAFRARVLVDRHASSPGARKLISTLWDVNAGGDGPR